MNFSQVFLSFTLHSFCHVFEIFFAIEVLHILKVFEHLTCNHFSAVLIFFNLKGRIGNNEGNYNFKSYDEVLDQNCEEDNVSSIPAIGVSLTHVSDQDRLFSRLKIVKILNNAWGICWEASEKQNWNVHGDGKVRDEAHDWHPVSDAGRALSAIPSTIFGDVLDLDQDF